ncbi:uncharacterized protein [Chelonus insularis]|uniref:uncharacterized protein isoform X2 n=1 Tax=Chelonus insularis TaxID=460826 RepID=UPI00158DEE86|nr:uncharacterized protein LOC118067288 isoform X2 [Chelonus insularis]
MAYLNNITSEDEVFRNIFLASLTSSPTVSSSSCSSGSSRPIDVPIDTCIDYIRSKITDLPNDVLDKFKKFMEECAPNGRVNWKTFREASQRWITSINSKWQETNNNSYQVNGEDIADSPDEGTSTDDPDILTKRCDSGKSSEFLEWSIVPGNNVTNDTILESEVKDVPIKSPKGLDLTKIGEAELHNRIRRFDEDNAWLRDELIRTEDLANSYQRQFYSVRQKFDKIKEKYGELERENEEQKEIIHNLEEQERKCQGVIEKIKKETKSYIKEIENNKQLITTLKTKIEKLNNANIKYAKQLSTYKTELEEKKINCTILQDQLDQMNKLNSNLENHYTQTIQNLQERFEELKNDNFKLQAKLNSNNLSMEASLIQSVHINSPVEDFFDEEINRPSPPDSLYAELRASGFSLNTSENNGKIQELEEELNWYNEEIHKAIEQISIIIQKLIQEKKLSLDENNSIDTCDPKSNYIPALLAEISILSNIVTEPIQKPLTSEVYCQVFAEPLESRGLDEFQISSFKSKLSNQNIWQSSSSARAFFTAPPVAPNQQNTEIQSRRIYTHPSRLNKRRWACKFSNELTSVLSGDGSMDANSSLSSHSSNELESKINFRPTVVVVDDTVEKKDNEIAKSIYVDKNSSQESPSENKSFNSIITTPKMSEKNIPRRKFSVFSRSIDLDKMLHPQCVNDILTTSTPAQPQNFSATSYRTTTDLSDSSNSLSPSQLDTSTEEEKIDRVFIPTTRETTTLIAPAKLTLPIQKDSIELDLSNTSNNSVTHVQGDTSACSDLFATKLIDTPKLYIYGNIDNDKKQDIQGKRRPKSDVTWIAQTDVDSSYHGRSSRAVNEKEPVKSSAVTLEMSSGEDSSDSSNSEQVVICDNKQIVQKIDNNITHDLCDSLETSQSLTSELSNYPVKPLPKVSNGINDKTFTYKPSNSREIILTMKRSRSESESYEDQCTCNLRTSKLNNKIPESNLMIFPSLADFRMQESGIANLSENDEQEKDLSEADIEKKYLAFSLGLSTDRLTLTRRRAFSLRQRDQTEHNLANEITRMSQNVKIARRRASIATIFRPIGAGQDNTKEGVRQRNSVSGRVTVRRPSFSTDSQRWEMEKLNKTESSNSVGELREIFEHIESRRASKEENNNIMLQVVTNSEGSSLIVPSTITRSYNTEELPVAIINEEEPLPDSRTVSRMLSMPISHPISWRSLIWCIIIGFFIGFFMKDVVSSKPCNEGSFRWWTLEEILGRHVEKRCSAPLPI